MKYLIVSDIHGSETQCEKIKELCSYEKPDEIVILGDLADFGPLSEECLTALASLPTRPHVVEGNCDRGYQKVPEVDDEGVSYLPYAFSRQLFFTHGHYYGLTNMPSYLRPGDVFVYGHTHYGGLGKMNDIYICNCGSLARPHDGTPSYIVIDETGIMLKSSVDNTVIQKKNF